MDISDRDIEVIIDLWNNLMGDSTIPNLSQGKQKDGKIYCWDRYKKVFVIIDSKPLSPAEVPEEIISAFMSEGYPAPSGNTKNSGDTL